MSSVVISGDTSGAITVSAPAVAGTNTLTLQAATATNAVNTLGTAVASTSSTAIDFTGLPSWVKRITVMFSGVSTNGSSIPQIQIGAGAVATTGYISNSSYTTGAAGATATATSGYIINNGGGGAANIITGSIVLNLLNTSTGLWVAASNLIFENVVYVIIGGGSKTLSGTLDRVRITTVNGTDTFDAGTINILYEG